MQKTEAEKSIQELWANVKLSKELNPRRKGEGEQSMEEAFEDVTPKSSENSEGWQITDWRI